MTRERIKEFILHPAFLSLPVWIVIILLIPPLFSKYSVRHLKNITLSENSYLFYSDLDNDGSSEMISVDIEDNERTKIIVYKDNKVVDQHNIRYQPTNLNSILFDDYNLDNYLEMYVFTVSEDSIFLNIIDPLNSRKIILSDRFIDTWKKASYSDNRPNIKPLALLKAGEPESDLFFLIITGYALYPRSMYRYIIEKDSLLKSPQAGFIMKDCTIYDVNYDGVPEFLPDIQAAGNHKDDDYPYTDMFSWFILLNHNLQFLFEPVRLHPKPSVIYLAPLRQKGEIVIAAYLRYFGPEEITSSLCLFDVNGNKIKEIPAENYDPQNSRILSGDYSGYRTFFSLRNLDGDVEEHNTQFNIVRKLTIPAVSTSEPLALIDADGDGRNEYIFSGIDRRSLVFVTGNFRYTYSWKLNEGSNTDRAFLVSKFLQKGKKQALYFQFQNHGLFLRYQSNLLYYLRYPLYLAIYASILAFILLLSRIQSYRLRQKQETEKRIASLQMKAIKNQIDPHFTLNILNSIGALYSDSRNRNKADYLFGKYARLIRQTVISSDQIIVPLEAEIDFTRNYLDLERFRNQNSFNYSIEIGEDVDMQAKIPRMLIHTFIENSVKYGVRQREKDGMIRVDIRNQNGFYEIIIEDNGPGISKDEHQGTGKGLRILDELADLYFRLEKSKITYTLENITENQKTVSGTRATVKIQKQKG